MKIKVKKKRRRDGVVMYRKDVLKELPVRIRSGQNLGVINRVQKMSRKYVYERFNDDLQKWCRVTDHLTFRSISPLTWIK